MTRTGKQDGLQLRAVAERAKLLIGGGGCDAGALVAGIAREIPGRPRSLGRTTKGGKPVALGRYVSDLEPGDVIGPVEYTMSRFVVREYCHANELHHAFFQAWRAR
jgi:hypothetical protein